jgi:hypothetical protein
LAHMDIAAVQKSARLPRFRRASEPPAFRLTDDEVETVRPVAQFRFPRSTHIAALVRRSVDRTNDRLLRLYHAGYIDRPRAQLDYYPTAGSAPITYALANRGARLLRERDGLKVANSEVSRKNRKAHRPFIEHQIEIVNFQVALHRAVRNHPGVRIIPPLEIKAASRQPMQASRSPFALRAKLAHRGVVREISVIPDIVFGLELPDGSRRYFMVETVLWLLNFKLRVQCFRVAPYSMGDQWPAMIDFMTGAMVRLENALREPLAAINRKLRTRERAALAPAPAGLTVEAAEGS